MNPQPIQYTLFDNLLSAIRTFLAAPPAATPVHLITAFSEALQNLNVMLPPHLFYEAVECANIAISITDLEANVLYANPAFEQVTGYSSTEIVGQNESILSNKTTSSVIYETMWKCLRQQQSWSGILSNQHKDGHAYLAEVNIAPVLDVNQQTLYYLAMHRDVTNLHRLEQQVQHQKNLIESVVDSAPVVMVLLEETGNIVLANQKYKKLAAEFSATEPITWLLNAIKAQLQEKYTPHHNFTNVEVQFELGGREPAHWFACSGHWFTEIDNNTNGLLAEQSHTYFLLVANDITALKRQQEEMRTNALRALLAEAELTEGMHEMLAGAIHQLAGPINLITAAISMLKRRAQSQGKEEPLCLALQETLEKSTQVLDELRQCIPNLDHPTEPVRLVNLNELLRDLLSISTQRLLAQGIVVNWQPALVLPAILGHVGRLRSMFKHLLDNAIEAMSDSRSHRELGIRTNGDAETVKFVIEDTGPGIPEALRFKVFEPFFTTKKLARKTGMGLAAVQEIVNCHEGTIHLDSTYMNGCRMIIQFPTAHYRKKN